MKKPQFIILALLALPLASSYAQEPVSDDRAARREAIRKRAAEAQATEPKGHVFQPSHSPGDSTSIVFRNAPIYVAGQTLANLTGKEVFISDRVQRYPFKDVESKGIKASVAQALIDAIEGTEHVDVVVVEVGRYALAVVEKTKDQKGKN
jgi:hypothetical protein